MINIHIFPPILFPGDQSLLYLSHMTRVRFLHLQFLLMVAVRALYLLLLIIMMDRF